MVLVVETDGERWRGERLEKGERKEGMCEETNGGRGTGR